MKEKQFNSVSLGHCLFSQWTGDLGLLEIIYLSTDQDCCWAWRGLILTLASFSFPTREGGTRLSHCIKVRLQCFSPRQLLGAVGKPDVWGTLPPLTYSGKECEILTAPGPTVSARSWAWVGSSVSFGLEAQPPGSPWSCRTRNIPLSSLKLCLPGKPSVSSEKSRVRSATLLHRQHSQGDKGRAGWLLRAPATSPPSQTEVIWESECDTASQNSHPGSLGDGEGVLDPQAWKQ